MGRIGGVVNYIFTKTINKSVIEMMESLDKAKKPEDIDQIAIAKQLANIKALQGDVRKVTMIAAKMSTFGIVRTQGTGDDAKPVAFTITPAQRATLLADVKELAKRKGEGPYDHVDGSAEVILGTLTMQLPTSVP